MIKTSLTELLMFIMHENSNLKIWIRLSAWRKIQNPNGTKWKFFSGFNFCRMFVLSFETWAFLKYCGYSHPSTNRLCKYKPLPWIYIQLMISHSLNHQLCVCAINKAYFSFTTAFVTFVQVFLHQSINSSTPSNSNSKYFIWNTSLMNNIYSMRHESCSSLNNIQRQGTKERERDRER